MSKRIWSVEDLGVKMHVTSSILLGIKFRVEHLEPDETGRRFVSLDISIFLALFWMVLWPPHYSSGPPSNVGGKDHGSSFAIIKLNSSSYARRSPDHRLDGSYTVADETDL
jgi:hypothetical protein